MIQEEANSTLYQKRRNDWSKTSIYTLKLLSKQVKQVTKCHAFLVYLVVENIETLNGGCCLCICVCVCVCVCERVRACVRGVPRCVAGSHPDVGGGGFGRVSE